MGEISNFRLLPEFSLVAPTKTHPLHRRDAVRNPYAIASLIEHMALGFVFEYRRFRGDLARKL